MQQHRLPRSGNSADKHGYVSTSIDSDAITIIVGTENAGTTSHILAATGTNPSGHISKVGHSSGKDPQRRFATIA